MYDIAMLVFAAVAAVFAVLAVLPSLGFDIRIRGRQTVPLAPAESRRTRKAWLALVLALISLGLSVGAFYYFFRPRVTEKLVEKVVEKQVPIPCPEQRSPIVVPIPSAKPSHKSGITKATPIPPLSFQNSPGSAVSYDQKGGVTAGTIITTGPKLEITDAQMVSISDGLKAQPPMTTQLKVTVENSELEVGDRLAKALQDGGLEVSVMHAGMYVIPGGPSYPGISFVGVNDSNQSLVAAIERELTQAKVVDGPIKKIDGMLGMKLEVVVRRP